MEDRRQFIDAPEVASRLDPTERRASTGFDVQRGDPRHTNAYLAQQNLGTNEHSIQPENTIVFRNHAGDRYIWPYELCLTFNAVKPLLLEIYDQLKDEFLTEKILKGEYTIQNNDGINILPSVWSSIVKPSSTIQIQFWAKDVGRYSPEARGSVHSLDAHESEILESIQHEPDRRDRIQENDKETRFDVHDTEQVSLEPYGPLSQVDDSEDNLSDQSSTEEADAVPQPDATVLQRDFLAPIDAEGNKLSFQVDTGRSVWHATPNKQTGSGDNDFDGRDGGITISNKPAETLRITKAISAERDNRSIIQIHVLPGPENAQLRDCAGLSWHHITANRLDYTVFKNTCLSIPNLPNNSQTLVRELLAKVEQDKVKAFLDGMFIEPGTVLRADDKNRAESESVIFSCMPYFDLQSPAKGLSSGANDRLFPPRTLMQSYYPYEPVRERDAEQAYRKFGDDHSGRLIHVPSLWTMNIGRKVVITSGYRPLAEEMVKSIAIIDEDLKQLGSVDLKKNTVTTIRLTDWDGRVLLYSLSACRSYFQMEQKARELRRNTRSNAARDVNTEIVIRDGHETLRPGDWKDVVKRNNVVFIDLTLVKDKVSTNVHDKPGKAVAVGSAVVYSSSVPPFFHWPRISHSEENEQNQGFIPADVKQSIRCLEDVERGMMSETLDVYDTFNAVDKTFTTPAYYKGLKEDSHEDLCAGFSSLVQAAQRAAGAKSASTHHQAVVASQCTGIVKCSAEFFDTAHATLALFVENVNKSTTLRKVWGAMAGIYQIAVAVESRGAIEADLEEYMDPSWTHPLMTERAWFIRNAAKDGFVTAPPADKSLERSIRRCRRCRSAKPFQTPEDALEHLRRHVASVSQSSAQAEPDVALDSSLGVNQSLPELAPSKKLRDWIVNYAQLKREESNGGALAILKQACETAQLLFLQAQDLAEGVQNEDGNMSELYTFPHRLLEAFRGIIVFYLAIERALHYTEESYQRDNFLDDRYDSHVLPFSEHGLAVLGRFGEGAKRSLLAARQELCAMVKSEAPPNSLENLSLGPEYVCSWLMRRLLVKPLEGQMTVGDMYREYLSTIQFQVNHRPGKRLLRDINLLQEELNVLSEINNWQTKLVLDYIRVLDDQSYEKDVPSRRAMFPYEQMLLRSCLEQLAMASEEYADLIRRCGPLSDKTKQSLEINEEDHGKAIMIFTIVTVIFLPLSFVTSYLGMNTVDIRDMGSGQSIFYIIAIPLTVVTVGACVLVGYNGDELRDLVMSLYRAATGKQDRRTTARGISVAQRKRARKLHKDSSSTLDYSTLADDAEYASPTPEYCNNEYRRNALMLAPPPDIAQPTGYAYNEPASLRVAAAGPRARFETANHDETVAMAPASSAQPVRTSRYHRERDRSRYDPFTSGHVRENDSDDEWYKQDGKYRRVVYPRPPPIIRASAVYEANEGVTGYTWHKRRDRRYNDRGRDTGHSKTWGETRGEY